MTDQPPPSNELVDVKWTGRASGERADQPGPALVPILQGPLKASLKQPRFAITPGKMRAAFFYRWKIALLVGLLLAVAGAGIAWATYQPKYTATAGMRLSSIKSQIIPGAHRDDSRKEEFFQITQIQVLKSRQVLTEALRKDRIRGLATIRQKDNAVGWLEKELQVGFVRGTDFLRIGLSGENPEDLADIVNTIRDVYLVQFVDFTKEQQATNFETLERALATAEQKINERRKELRKLAETYKTGDKDILNHTHLKAIDELSNLTRERSMIESKLREKNAILAVHDAQLKAIKSDDAPFPPGLIDEALDRHPQIQKEKYEIIRHEFRISEYLKSVTGANPRLTQMQQELETARNHLNKTKLDLLPEVTKSLRSQLVRAKLNKFELDLENKNVLQTQLLALDKQVKELSDKADRIGVGSIEIQFRQSELAEAETILKKLRAEKERLEIERLNNREPVVTKQDADVPTLNQASLMKTGSLYSIAGLLLGFLGVSFLEARLHRVHKPTEVHQELGIQTLGVLPLLAQNPGRVYGRTPAVSESVPEIMYTDAVNGLCASLLCDDRLSHSSVIMVTSASEDEGKTMLASQLAAGLARSGRRTLLLDCDFRNPRCHHEAGLADSPGLSEVLCGETELATALQTVPDSEVRILTAGRCNPQVIKSLSNGTFAKLLDQLRQEFDCIIVDSAPTPIVSDGLLIGKLADGVILVIRSKVSKAPAVYAAYEQLAALKIPILGAVVNANPGRPSSRYYAR